MLFFKNFRWYYLFPGPLRFKNIVGKGMIAFYLTASGASSYRFFDIKIVNKERKIFTLIK